MTIDLDQHKITRPLRRSYRRAHWLLVRHPLTTMLWVTSVALMVTAMALNSAPHARAGLFVAVFALMASMVATARWIVARMTQVVALWEEDVPLADEANNLYPLHRGDRARDHA